MSQQEEAMETSTPPESSSSEKMRKILADLESVDQQINEVEVRRNKAQEKYSELVERDLSASDQIQLEDLRKEMDYLRTKGQHLMTQKALLMKEKDMQMQILRLKQETGPSPKRLKVDGEYSVVHVTGSQNVSSLARNPTSVGEICEDQPIFVHWFGLEMLSAYESAKKQIDQGMYPIKMKLGSNTYEIEHDSLEMVTHAMDVATRLFTSSETWPGYRGFSGSAEVCRTEVAMTCLVSRALDRFIFQDQHTGACLHQAPCRNPERPDIYITSFKEFYPDAPGVLSDWKLTDFAGADRESSLYSCIGVSSEHCTNRFPVLIGIPGTRSDMELQLHVYVHKKFWKLKVASGCPSDRALLCTLKVGVEHLIQKDFSTTTSPFDNPVPFKDMDQYSILGGTKRVFFNKLQNTVYKFFDTKTDDFFHPSILHNLIGQVEPLPGIKLTPSYSEDVRLYTLTYTYIKEINRASNKLKAFVGVVRVLSQMHRHQIVHGDIQLVNIVFSNDRSYLIDFDFIGYHNSTRYPANYNSDLVERHKMAVGGSCMQFEHDRYSLVKIIDSSCVISSVDDKNRITTKLNDMSCSLEQIAQLLDQLEE